MKYTKIAVDVDACQIPIEGESRESFEKWAKEVEFNFEWSDEGIHIETLEGTMQAGVTDWVIKGTAGEFYPCKDDIFQTIYCAKGDQPPEIVFDDPPEKEQFTGWTMENLQEVQRKRGFQGLKDIGKTLGVTSSGSKMLIDKILNAQDERREQQNPSEAVEFNCANIQDLYRRPVNMEEGLGPDDQERPRFPPLVDEQEGAIIIAALEKFGVRWGFTFEFVLKFQAFRCLKDGAHVDWIQINELCKMYSLPINPSVLVLSKRLYTAPTVRAWRPE